VAVRTRSAPDTTLARTERVRSHTVRPAVLYGVAAVGSLLVLAAVLYATGVVSTPRTSAESYYGRATVLCLGLTGLAVVPYLAWPSRWNIAAHTQLAFCVVAYVIPIYGLNSLSTAPDEALNLYVPVIVVGFFCCAAGALLGGRVTAFAEWKPWLQRVEARVVAAELVAPRRVMALALLSVAGMLVSFAVMGFVPAFAANPYAAKFFRGEYAASYAPVAPLYRFATTIISLLLPLVTVYLWRFRTAGWVLTFAGSLAVMLVSLQREPAVSGVLVAVGVLIAVRPRGMFLYFVGLLAVYTLGSGLYFLLAQSGLDAFSNGSSPSTSWLQEIAAGSPDVSDQLTFLRAWHAFPQYTHGLTFIGGLVPGNFRWNPSVWSLSIVNPSQSVSDIQSGGLRLPAPIWGLVSFGWLGVVVVSFLSGVFAGLLAGWTRRVIERRDVEGAALVTTFYLAVQDLLPVFFRLSYLSVIGLLVILFVLYTRRPAARGRVALGVSR
jgi:hypothetical protein